MIQKLFYLIIAIFIMAPLVSADVLIRHDLKWYDVPDAQYYELYCSDTPSNYGSAILETTDTNLTYDAIVNVMGAPEGYCALKAAAECQGQVSRSDFSDDVFISMSSTDSTNKISLSSPL